MGPKLQKITLASFGLFYILGLINPEFARFHRDAPGGLTLWHIFIGVILVVVVFASIMGGDPSKKEKEENEKRATKTD